MSDKKPTPNRLRELLAPYEFDAQGCGGRKVLKLSLEEAEELIGVDYSKLLVRALQLLRERDKANEKLEKLRRDSKCPEGVDLMDWVKTLVWDRDALGEQLRRLQAGIKGE